MSTKVIVEAISSKEVNTKFGMKPTYSFKGNDGQWYKMGFKKPQFNKGDELEFEFSSGRYGNEVTAVLTPPSATPPATLSRTYAGGPSGAPQRPVYSRGTFPIPPTDGQRSIIRQNSLTNSLKFFEVNGKETLLTVEQVLKVARLFEAYSAGDTEAAAARKAIKEAKEPEES